jgi:predicted nucleic acid-binding protein
MPKIYLDNCSLNRPFDDQGQRKIYLETEAIYFIQLWIHQGYCSLAWSFMLDYEIRKSPYDERRNSIIKLREIAQDFCKPFENVMSRGIEIERLGVKHEDALHIASAIELKCEYFITTDKQLFNKKIQGIETINPIDFVIKMEAKT